MSRFDPPNRCLRRHDQAVSAKWCAFLITRTKAYGPDYSLPTRSGAPLYLKDIAERLTGICYAGTPEATPEEVGHYFPQQMLNVYQLCANIYQTAYHADCSFPWRDAVHGLQAIGVAYPRVDKQYLECFNFTWQEREQIKLASGAYLDLPWDLEPIKDHFAHLSMKDAGLVAFTENAEKGERDIQTQMKPGRYLKQFYPDLSDEAIAVTQAKVGQETEVRFATDADEIERVYTNGPHSCMAGSVDRWKGNVSAHPTRAYAGGDLAVAYLTNKKGRCNARAVVWPAKKVYFRRYGDERLDACLRKLGYKQGGNFCFQGAKLRKHKNKARSGTFLAVHLDGNGRYSPLNDDFLVIDQNGPYTSGAQGYMALPTLKPCGCGCGGKDMSNNMIGINLKGEHQLWSRRCIDRAIEHGRLIQCRYTETYIHPSEAVLVNWDSRMEQMYFSLEAAKRQCNLTANGKWYSKEYYRFTRLDNGELWEQRDLRRKQDTHTLSAGGWIAKERTKAS